VYRVSLITSTDILTFQRSAIYSTNMFFNSNLFLAYLPIVVYVYYLLTPYYRRIFLLITSYIFYCVWNVPLSLLMLFYTLVAYGAARIIDGTEDLRLRKFTLWGSLAIYLGILGVFKYANFLGDSVYSLFNFHPWPSVNLLLPLGISFYTFEVISYTLDVYWKKTKADKSVLDLALYVVFFPHLIAGPIIRADELIPQLLCISPVDWVKIRNAIAQILWGMLKKVYIADPMGKIANEAYSNPSVMSGAGLIVGTYAFAIQVYCDFSGYSDIAIGASRLFGIELPQNFDKPYLAHSITNFWRRWHISLSNWLRDYLYIPLGGNRLGKMRTYINLMITMLLGGLWHGAGWNWVIWGGLQGMMLSVERATGLAGSSPKTTFENVWRWAITFHFVCFSWIFFRANNLGDAIVVLQRIFTWSNGSIPFDIRPILCLVGLLLVEVLNIKEIWMNWLEMQPRWTRWITYVSLVVLFFTFAGTPSPEFIYFQF
jgi:alginate O-acetyltransferase complex protein AlgI